MDGKPVDWINVAAEGRGLDAQRPLGRVMGYLGAAVLEPAGRRVFVPRDAVGPDGVLHDVRIRAEIADALRTFAGQLAVAAMGASTPQSRAE